MKKAMVYVKKGNRDLTLETIRQNSDSVFANYDQSFLIQAEDDNLKTLETKGYRVREIDDTPVVEVGAYKVNTTMPSIRSTHALSAGMALPSGLSHQIMHIIGPMHHDWKRQGQNNST